MCIRDRHTTIRTFTNSRLIVPNSVMNREVLENSHIIDPVAGGFLDITIAYTADIDKAMDIIVECVESDENVLDLSLIHIYYNLIIKALVLSKSYLLVLLTGDYLQ